MLHARSVPAYTRVRRASQWTSPGPGARRFRRGYRVVQNQTVASRTPLEPRTYLRDRMSAEVIVGAE